MSRNSKILELLEAAAARRADLRRVTNALRVVNGPGDDLAGLVLDQYDRHFVAQIFQERWLEQKTALTDFVQGQGGCYLMVKDRTRSTEANPQDVPNAVWLEDGPPETMVQEHGLRFRVEFGETLNTGLFLDMRANRALVAELCAGRRVFNGFAYTCSFGVHARARGAAEVVNVDISRKSLDRGRENYALNNLVPGPSEFTRADADQYLQRAVKKDNRFDVIILDPPSFARHEGGTFSVKKDLARLTEDAIRILAPGGLLFVSTNLSDVTPAHLVSMVQSAAGERAVQDIRRLGPDRDFPTGIKLKTRDDTEKGSHLAAVLARLG